MSKSIGVVVGINEYESAPLSGCVNDVVAAMKLPLMREHGFSPDNTRMLVDKRATTEAILERLEWMVKNASAGDKALFYYSGHGAPVPARGDAGEVDGMDEVLCPVDFNWESDHMITDNQLASIFAKFDPGVRFVMITDCCHSGTLTRGIKLTPTKPTTTVKQMIPPADIAWRMANGAKKRVRRSLRSLPNSVHISGCRDDQTSADAWFVNAQQYRGALSYYLEQELSAPGFLTATVEDIIGRVRVKLSNDGFDQVPQISGNVAAPLWFQARPEPAEETNEYQPAPGAFDPPNPSPIWTPLKTEKLIQLLSEWHAESGKSLANLLSRL